MGITCTAEARTCDDRGWEHFEPSSSFPCPVHNPKQYDHLVAVQERQPDKPSLGPILMAPDGEWFVVDLLAHGWDRHRVIAWLTVTDSDTTWLEPMVENIGGGPSAVPASEVLKDGGRHLWHRGDSRCSCGEGDLHSGDEDDPDWCKRCRAEIG